MSRAGSRPTRWTDSATSSCSPRCPMRWRSGLLDVPPDRADIMSARRPSTGPDWAALTRAAEIISAALDQMRGATSPRLLLELMCAQVLLPAAATGESSVLARLERLEAGAAAVSRERARRRSVPVTIIPNGSGLTPQHGRSRLRPRPAAAPGLADAACRRQQLRPHGSSGRPCHGQASASGTAQPRAQPGPLRRRPAERAGRARAAVGAGQSSARPRPAGRPASRAQLAAAAAPRTLRFAHASRRSRRSAWRPGGSRRPRAAR